ncbi:aminoglycoside phosphotransferase family protein [Arsenicicoccus dermatophilus]|uniref:aminoglycoside phosphotransferase family protein n=1 Tax=Arsenicicoccus dermatophilus TaxID=1076331 RepID=UPI0039170BE8
MSVQTPDAALVTLLLREQAPHLADLPVRASDQAGSSNWVFRVGDGHAVRLPRSDDYVADLRTETRWLPVLAPHLCAPVPDVVLAGEPTVAFPRPWSVVTWVPGTVPGRLDAAQQGELARTLGEFVASLHAVDTADVPAGAEHWGYRCGEPVTDRIDAWVAEAAAELADLLDPGAVRRAWQRLRDVPPATAGPCWVHSDLSAENVLVDADGRLAGVIDFGALGVGDPSVDLLYAWSLFDAPARGLLRAAAGADEATWLRARAWAFVGPGLVTIASYRHTHAGRTQRLLTMVEAVAAEVDIALR